MWKDGLQAWRSNRKKSPRCLNQEAHVVTSARSTASPRMSRAATQEGSKLAVSNADLVSPAPHPVGSAKQGSYHSPDENACILPSALRQAIG